MQRIFSLKDMPANHWHKAPCAAVLVSDLRTVARWRLAAHTDADSREGHQQVPVFRTAAFFHRAPTSGRMERCSAGPPWAIYLSQVMLLGLHASPAQEKSPELPVTVLLRDPIGAANSTRNGIENATRPGCPCDPAARGRRDQVSHWARAHDVDANAPGMDCHTLRSRRTVLRTRRRQPNRYRSGACLEVPWFQDDLL